MREGHTIHRLARDMSELVGPDPLRPDADPGEVRRRISPDRRAGDLSDSELEAVPEGRPRRAYRLRYDCGTPVQTARNRGRASYSCPGCRVR